jgi:uncharacterized protein with gpF-like domain
LPLSHFNTFRNVTAKERQAYSQDYINHLNRLERKYTRRIFNALASQVQQFINDMESYGLPTAQNRLLVTIGNDEITSVLQDLHKESALYFGKKAYYEIRRSARKKIEKAGFGLSEEWLQAIIDFFNREYFALVQQISDTTRDVILNVLSKAAEEGWSNDTIVKQLKAPEINASRARLIARTELNKGAYFGRKLATDDSEWETEKEWVAANDHRTRHSHRAVDGDVIDVDGKFAVSTPKGGTDYMLGPGDPTASAANVCNCRCVTAVRAKRDENGRLIPKARVIPIRPGSLSQTG